MAKQGFILFNKLFEDISHHIYLLYLSYMLTEIYCGIVALLTILGYHPTHAPFNDTFCDPILVFWDCSFKIKFKDIVQYSSGFGCVKELLLFWALPK